MILDFIYNLEGIRKKKKLPYMGLYKKFGE